MEYMFFTASDYVDQVCHVSATEKTISGKSDFHMHDFFEIELIIDGNGTHMINGNECELKRGSVYLLPPGSFHGISCTPELKLINIMFDESIILDELVSKIFSEGSHYHFILDDESFFDTYILATQLVDNVESNSEYSKLYVKNLVNCIIIKIMDNCRQSILYDKRESPALLNNVMRFLYNNFKDDPSLEEAAALSGYSPNYFSKIFTEYTGKSYVDFLNTLKVTHAKMLLSSSGKTVSEIAFFCGFSSLSNFYRVFRKETKTPPLNYRKQTYSNKKKQEW